MRHGGIDEPTDIAVELIGVSGGSLLVRTITMSGQGADSMRSNHIKFIDLATGDEVQNIKVDEAEWRS